MFDSRQIQPLKSKKVLNFEKAIENKVQVIEVGDDDNFF